MSEDLSILTRRASAPDLSLAYGAGPDQIGDVRYGARGDRLPLVVLIHGGFWKPQYDRVHAEAMSSALAIAGWTVLTLEYRRIPGNPDATFKDISSALESLPEIAGQHNGQILLLGHSAGGHLVLRAAAKSSSARLQGVLALAPAADLQLAHALNLGDGAVRAFLGADPADWPDADPMRLPAPSVAVTIVQGGADAIVPPAVVTSYCAIFPKTRLVQLPDCGHFAVIDPLSTAWPIVLEELQRLSET